jgi:hypothetical protein
MTSAAAEVAVSIWSTFPYGFAAAGIFALLGFITWSYRDVANRHSDKNDDSKGHH